MATQSDQRITRSRSREPQPFQAPYQPPSAVAAPRQRKPLVARNFSSGLHRGKNSTRSAPVILPSHIRNEDVIVISESEDELEPLPFKRRRVENHTPAGPSASTLGVQGNSNHRSAQEAISLLSSDDENYDLELAAKPASEIVRPPAPGPDPNADLGDLMEPFLFIPNGKGKEKEHDELPLFGVDDALLDDPPVEKDLTVEADDGDAPNLVPDQDGLPHLEELEVEDVPIDPASMVFADVLALFPDIELQYASDLITEYLQSHPDNASEAIINSLCDNPKYPRAEKRPPKRRRSDDTPAESSKAAAAPPAIDYSTTDRPHPVGAHYNELAMTQLQQDFRHVSVKWIRAAFANHNQLYYPSYKYLEQQIQIPNWVGFKKSATGLPKGKGVHYDEDFEAERAALLGGPIPSTSLEASEPEAGPSTSANLGAIEEEAGEIECGCCFGDYSFENMVQCPEAHLFCRDCVRRNADEVVGSRKPVVQCMDQSGCKLEFGRAELERVVDERVLELLDRIKAEKALAGVEIEGLEECPFCDFKVIIENEEEKLFRCDNENCSQVSCRKCKKPDHLPKSCQEMEEDKKLDARHAVEEAMTAALMRKCPKCSKAFIKEHGCNKMSCPNCATLSCYVCRQIITGYDHFNQAPAEARPKNNGKCALWDDLEKRHHQEVAEAARIAREQQQRENPDIDHKILDVELPKAPAAPGANPGALLPPPMQIAAQQLPYHVAHPRGLIPPLMNNIGGLFLPGAPQPPPPFLLGYPQPGPNGYGQQLMAMRAAQEAQARNAEAARQQVLELQRHQAQIAHDLARMEVQREALLRNPPGRKRRRR